MARRTTRFGKKDPRKGVFKRLGKFPAKRDPRNLMLKSVAVPPSSYPSYYNFDRELPDIPHPMFGNNQWGNCVIAGRGHQTLRFEYFTQKQVIPLTDAEIVEEYLGQTGGQDTGLYVLDSLKLWRINGWIAGGERYFIKAFTEIDRENHALVKLSVFLEIGVGLGLQLPKSAETQFNKGKPWTINNTKLGEPNSWGGHYVYVVGYTKSHLICFTWGKVQYLSWGFFNKYCDEAYAIIDDINTEKKKQILQKEPLEKFLKTCSLVKVIKRKGAVV